VFEHNKGEIFMKFTKPINREVAIDGQDFVVSFDDNQIEFRLKGKRKTARVAWSQVLDIARGEDGEDARALLGLDSSTAAPHGRQAPASQAQNEDAMARTINPPAPAPLSQPDGSAQSPPTATPTPDSPEDYPSASGETADRDDEQGRAVTAGDIGPES
jgi:hypothetical protein